VHVNIPSTTSTAAPSAASTAASTAAPSAASTAAPSAAPPNEWKNLPKSGTIPSKVILPSSVTYIKPAFPFTQNDYSLNDEELCNEDDNKDDEKDGKLPFEIITTNFSTILASLKQSLTSNPSRSDIDRANDIIMIKKKENPTEETLQINFNDAFSGAD
jgi:hypothetical protein